MNYFRREKDKICKYEVIYDRNEILAIRGLIINDCSGVLSKSVDATNMHFMMLYKESFRNVKDCGVVGLSNNEEVHHYTYNELVYPKVVELLDRFLEGKVGVLPSIYNCVDILDEDIYDIKIKEAMEEADKVSNFDVNLKIEKLEQLKELMRAKQKIKDNNKVAFYIEQIKDKIEIRYVDEISIYERSKFLSFISSNNYNKKY